MMKPVSCRGFQKGFQGVSKFPQGVSLGVSFQILKLFVCINILKLGDPAAGSGNFLTESYLCLRKLENEVISLLFHGQVVIGAAINPIKVSIAQFYGIEINDFAATVAKTALWIAESQMMKKTEDIVHMQLDMLPLKSYANIVCDNALRIDWNSVIPAQNLFYIMGNPPFVGTKMQSKTQKDDMQIVFFNNPRYKKLDYVAAWYKKACDYVGAEKIQCAFVSTNSVVQGEMVDILWRQLFEEYNCQFNYVYKTFRWDSEATLKAAVHCVIIGFSCFNSVRPKFIYDGSNKVKCQNINAYIMDAPNVFIEKVQKSLCGLPQMTKGAQLIDDGNYVFNTKQEMIDFMSLEPSAKPFIKRYYNATVFLNRNAEMYCLYLENCSPAELRKMPYVLERVNKVKVFRETSTAPSVYAIKDTPSKYFIPSVPTTKRIIIPIVSSERRRYIPIDISSEEAVYTNALNYIENAPLWLFALLCSNVHNAWMRATAGRLKSDYRYSKDLIYNTLPIPQGFEQHKELLNKSGQAILDARALYPDSSLADLYDELTMPSELRKAHQQNDIAVMQAYGMPIKETTESSCVAELMRRYQALTAAKGSK